MHTAMYVDNPDVNCVIHTHSPYATAYLVAHRPIGCWVEALAMFGLASGVPVTEYGPRGSDLAVANIRSAITPGVPAILLANHGVLVLHNAAGIGGARRDSGRAARGSTAAGDGV
jgi:L-ribulose-5-phosphate 4-epimerase